MRITRRSPLLKLAVLLLLITLIAQTGVWIGTLKAPAAANTASNAPRMASIAGNTSDGNSGVTNASPFETGSDVMHDVSPPLRDIQAVPYEKPSTIREMTEPGREDTGNAPLPPVTDPVVQYTFGNQQMAPAPAQNFEGVTNRNGVYPPDTNGDVGPNHYVQIVNLSLQIFNKSGGTLYGP